MYGYTGTRSAQKGNEWPGQGGGLNGNAPAAFLPKPNAATVPVRRVVRGADALEATEAPMKVDCRCREHWRERAASVSGLNMSASGIARPESSKRRSTTTRTAL